MFEIRSNSPMDARWLERDAEIRAAAGRNSKFSGAGVGEGSCVGRDHGWYEETMDAALNLKRRLEAVAGVTVTIREK